MKKDLKQELDQIADEKKPEVCGINTSIHSESQLPSNESIKEELADLSEKKPEVCGINTSVHSESQLSPNPSLKEELADLSEKKPEVCGINTTIHSESQISPNETIKEELADLSEKKPEVCGINTSIHSAAQTTQSEKIKEELEKIAENNKPEICGIDKNATKPEVCGISQSKKEELEAIAASERPEVCGIDANDHSPFANIKENSPEVCGIKHSPTNKPNIRQDHAQLLSENIIDTYGYNVPASPEEIKTLLAGFAEQEKEEEEEEKEEHVTRLDQQLITVVKNGPYIVRGDVPIYDTAIKIDKSGQSIGWDDTRELRDKKVVVLCRCGRSKNMPFCDDTHLHVNFDGTCTASNKPYDEAANIYKGCQGVYLMDEESLCAIVRFCDPDGSCWNLIKDEKTVDIALEESYNCASGRLTLVKDGKKCEPKLEKEIEAIYDTERDVLGPLYVKGGIPVKTETTDYEVRNRQTLCRCGYSQNKPFCDGMHLDGPKLNKAEIEENE